MNANVLEKLRSLPPERQQEVEDYICFLAQKYALPQHSGEEAISPHVDILGNSNGANARSAERPEDY